VGYYTHSLDAVLVLLSLVHVTLQADVHLVLGSVPMVIQRQGFAVAQKQEHLAFGLFDLLLWGNLFDVVKEVRFYLSHNDLLVDPQLAVSFGCKEIPRISGMLFREVG
jgi:hypothetical protein